MKSRIIKRNLAIGAASLATIITAGAILNSVLSVKAEETLFGIETLIQEVQSRQTPYRILEIVPDEKASEIGYYIPGYEPVLSTREAGTGVWSEWAEGLKKYRTEETRTEYMEGLNQALENFYALRGFSGNNVPVSYDGYVESEEPKNGYNELVFDAEVRKGYFREYSGVSAERYHLDFYYAGNYDETEFTGELSKQYYYVEDAAQITVGMLENLADSTVLYRFISQVGADRFEEAGTWAELKEQVMEELEASVSGNDASVSGGNSSVSGGNGSVSDGNLDPNLPTEFFQIKIVSWQQGITPAYLALYAVEDMDLADDGEFEFVDTEDGYENTFQLDTVYYKGGFTNNLWFHTNVLNMLPENASLFPIEVVTLTASELSAMAELPAFDMLYLNSGKQTVATDTVITSYSSTNNDIGDGMRLNLFRNVVSEAKPCIVDSAILYNTGSDGTITIDGSLSGTSIFRLAAMLEQTSPLQYYSETILTGAAEPDVTNLIATTVTDADKNFVVEQTYSFYQPMSLIGPEFAEKNIFKDGVAPDSARAQGFTVVLDEIVSENLNRAADVSGAYAQLPTDVSQATAVRHILNYKNRRQIDVKEHLRVLEIQPAKSNVSSYDLTAEEIKTWAPGVQTVEIDRITTAEFIGRIEDINENYDLIYIGTDKDTMNTVTGVDAFPGVKNGGFENGVGNWYVWGNTASVVAGGANGTSATLQTTNTTLTQVIAVEPGKTYTLTAFAKAAGGRCTVGVDFMRGTTDDTIQKNGAYELSFAQDTADFNQSSVTFTTWEGTNYVKVYIWSDVGVTAQIDEISLEHVVSGGTTASVPVDVPNGDFEAALDLDSDKGEWNTTCSIVAGGANGSNSALQVKATGGMGFIIPATAGEQYVVSGWGKVDTAGEAFSYGIDCLDANGNKISGGRAEIIVSATNYTQQSATFIAPTGTTQMQIFAWKESGTGAGYLDDVTISRVYTQSIEQKHAGGSTVFNDSTMDGLLYFHTGDLRYTAMELAGQLDTEYVGGDRANNVYYFNPMRYGGNDITEEKKDALISFLQASYPIVISDEVFESAVTVFADSDYRGYSVNLQPGTYNMDQLNALGVENDVISSIKVSEGYQVTLYNDIDFGGLLGTLTADSSYIGNEWNDKVTSLIVEEIEGQEDLRTRKIDEDHIDNSSYMYDFIAAALGQSNFYARSEISADSKPFQFYLNRPKVSVTNVSANGNVTESGVYDIYPDTNGRYTLEYKFTIENEGAASANTQYACQLFVDVNADGKYSENEELTDVSLTYNGETVSTTNLYIGREYVLRRTVPDGYKGVLPWKIQISQVNNPHIHNGVTGYTKLRGLERETLRILQVGRDPVTDRDWWGGANEKLFNLEAKIADPEDIYHILIYGGEYDGETYEGIYKDFDIDVDFMLISQFEEAYAANNDILKNYNMLILGFSDAYGNISGNAEEGPISAIIDFIEGGKSVLFAHDTVSYFNYEDGKRGVINRYDTSQTFLTDQYHNSYALTKYVRGLVGMDRYGITEIADLKKGLGLTNASTTWTDILKAGKDYAYIPGTNKTQTYGLTQGYTYSIINGKDRTVTNNALGSGSVVTYTDAMTGAGDFTNKYLNLDYGAVYYHDSEYDEGEIAGNYNAEVSNLWVTQVNHGQITDYPYKLKEEFMVSSTHNQYYQLDFMADDDKDGQSDLVVWYCLGYRTNGNGAKQETIYSMSPNDVSNNYYIYNKGNITYTGVGHSAMHDVSSTVEEAKLFINTMIASYNAGIKSPVITTLSEGDVESDVLTSSHIYYDEENNLLFDSNEATVSDDENMNKIFFTVSDPNFVKGTRLIAARFFYESDDADAQQISYNGETIHVKELPAEVYNAKTNQKVESVENLTSGGVYYILFDKSVMGDFESKFTIYFEAQSTIIANNTTVQTDKSYTTFDYTKVQLFNLE